MSTRRLSYNKVAPTEYSQVYTSQAEPAPETQLPPKRTSKRFIRQESNPWASISIDLAVNGVQTASSLSGDQLGGESNDPTLGLINYLSALLKNVEEDIDFNHMETLIDKGADVNAVCIETGLSIIQTVCINWDSSVAVFLIDKGADVRKADKFGRTCLHFAATADHAEMVECLLTQCDFNIECKTYKEQQTPIHYAIRSNSLNSLRTLVEHNGNYEARDSSGRTPLHLAAELDRTYAAKYLLSLEVPAECRVVDNNKTPLLSTMIRTMPGVAMMALNQLQFFVPSERKQYFLLSYLEPSPSDEQARRTKTPLEVAVEEERFDILNHPVMKELIVQKWKLFAKGYFLFYFFQYLAFLIAWSILFAYPAVQEKHYYNFPRDIWRVLLGLVALTLYFNQIAEEINEYLRSKTQHTINKVQLIKTLKEDLENTNSCFPEEKKYLKAELRRVKKSSPNYFKDAENYLDLITFFVIYLIVTLHLIDVGFHNEEVALWVARVSCFGAILIWVRLLKFLSAFKRMGPLIAILKSLIEDIIKYFILYGVFFIPYTICFFVLFGGVQSKNLEGADDLTSYPRVAVMCFRMSLIDEYPFETLRTVDEYMAAILVVTFLLFTAMIGLNLFIALLSNTFKSIYDNAQANAEMQKAAIILSLQAKAWDYWYKKYLVHIHTNCNPIFKYYDDDDLPMPVQNGNQLQETTARNKEVTSKLDDHHIKMSEDLVHVSGQIKYFSDSLVAMRDYQEQGLQYLFQQITELKMQLSSQQHSNLEGTSIQDESGLGTGEEGPQVTAAPVNYEYNTSDITRGRNFILPPIRNEASEVQDTTPEAGNTPREDHKDVHPRLTTRQQSVHQLLKEIFPRKAATTHHPLPVISLSPVHSESHMLPSAASSRLSLVDHLGSQPSYVVKNHRRYRARDEGDIRRDQWKYKIQRVIDED